MAVEDTAVLDTEASLFHSGAKSLGFSLPMWLGVFGFAVAFCSGCGFGSSGRIGD